LRLDNAQVALDLLVGHVIDALEQGRSEIAIGVHGGGVSGLHDSIVISC
jgi:hypothetical protein